MKRAWLVPLGLLLLIAVVYAAPFSSKFFVSGFLTNWTKTDTTLKVNVDTLGLYTQSGLQRKIDSLISLRAGASIREELKFTASGNSLSGTNDSINVLVDGTGHQIIQFPYDMYADRFVISTNLPGTTGPTTFRDDLPRVSSADSSLILRLSRNASFSAGQKIGLTLYKVDRGTGLSFTNTTGTFYDMVRIDEAIFNTPGTNTQFNIILLLKKNR